MPFHDWQLQWILRLSEYRTETLDRLFLFLNYFDSVFFVFVLVPIVWIGISYRWGIKIFYLMLLNVAFNSLLKQLVGWPRPSTDCPEVGLVHFNNGGFPSGAVQTSVMLSILLIYYWRTRLSVVIAVVYVAAMAFSRLYLGVHYPIDLLGGVISGSVVAIVFLKMVHPLERALISYLSCSRWVLGWRLAVAMILPVLGVALVDRNLALLSIGSVAGMWVGVYVSGLYRLYLPDAKTMPQRIYRGLFAALGVFLILGFGSAHIVLSGCVIALWMSLLASPLYRSRLKN